ncbi:MAG: DUF192 domain-containing protein [Planctomycetota bacterium]
MTSNTPLRRGLILAGLLFSVLAAGLFAGGCEEETSRDVDSVQIKGNWFHLELALDHTSRVRGLSGRDFIAEDGGMLFAFPIASVQQFVMRDCLVPIDIIYLDGAGRITEMHAMTLETPKGENESQAAYEARLKRYSSRFPAQFAIELRSGWLEELDLEIGERIDLDTAGLKRRAR